MEKLLICGPYRCDKLLNFLGVFDAFQRAPAGRIDLDAGADIHRQRFTAGPYLQNAIGHVGSAEPTT